MRFPAGTPYEQGRLPTGDGHVLHRGLHHAWPGSELVARNSWPPPGGTGC